MKKLLLASILAPLSLSALELPSIFSSHMVLQRDLANKVWGWDAPNAEVTVNFAGQTKTATADANGKWELKLDALSANATGQNMKINNTTGKAVVFNDILIGDVWICSGQSNMEWSVKQCLNADQEIKNANHAQIRLFDVPGHHTSLVPQQNLTQRSSWSHCSPKSIPGFSATGYYFGRELQVQSGVPIGLLGTNWGGTRVEPWTPVEGFAGHPELKDIHAGAMQNSLAGAKGKALWQAYLDALSGYEAKLKSAMEQNLPVPAPPSAPRIGHTDATSIYNAMVAPLVGYGVRGAIWYQGESNSGEGLAYLPKLKALVQGWRQAWEQPADFPLYFYVVKLAQFHQPNADPAGGDGFAAIRVAQDRIQELPHTGVASVIDIGDARDIHPKNKQDVGKRLAQWALRDVYKKEVVVAGPTYKSLEIQGNTAVISYDHVGSGLMTGKKVGLEVPKETTGEPVQHFAISGADKKWHWAQAKIVGESIHVSSDKVAAPVAVRFAYTSNPDKFNLYNKEGLPAVPFSTDL